MSMCSIEEEISRLATMERLDCADYQLLYQWGNNADAYIRDLVATLLAKFPDRASEKLLLHLAQDSDPLVRTDAYDSLAAYHSQQVFEALKRAVQEDKDDLARSYAILSCADVAAGVELTSESRMFFQSQYATEYVPICQVSYNYALYHCGDDCAYVRIFPFLNHPDYHVRCFAVSILSDIIDAQNIITIKEQVLTLQEIEKTDAVQSAINSFLENL